MTRRIWIFRRRWRRSAVVSPPPQPIRRGTILVRSSDHASVPLLPIIAGSAISSVGHAQGCRRAMQRLAGGKSARWIAGVVGRSGALNGKPSAATVRPGEPDCWVLERLLAETETQPASHSMQAVGLDGVLAGGPRRRAEAAPGGARSTLGPEYTDHSLGPCRSRLSALQQSDWLLRS